jgi:hypothetical protein
MQSSTEKIGCCRGTHDKEGHKAGDVRSQTKIKWKKTSVSPHGVWFSPTQDSNFEAMAPWLSGKANGKTIFYKMHEHFENHHKKSTEKKVGK